MVTNNSINVSTGALGTIQIGQGIGMAPSWSISTYPSTNAANTLLYASSANTMAALSTADYGVLITNSSGVPSYLTASTSWTPALEFGGASVGITYSTRTGSYTRIGNILFFYMDIELSSKGSSTGGAQVTGLPFAPVNNSNPMVVRPSVISYTGMIYARVSTDQTIYLEQVTTSGTISQTQDSNFSNSSSFQISGCFQIA